MIGTQPFCVAPRTGTVTPSPRTVRITPDSDGVERQRNPAPPVFTTRALVPDAGGGVGEGVGVGSVGGVVGTGVTVGVGCTGAFLISR